MLDRIVRAIRRPPAGLEEPAGLPWAALYPDRPLELHPRAYPPPRTVAASSASVLLAPANPARTSLAIVNDSTADLYVALGPIASSSSYSIHLGPGATAMLEDPDVWRGDVAGVWTVAAGAARLTELAA